jgi:hypothetical protein
LSYYVGVRGLPKGALKASAKLAVAQAQNSGELVQGYRAVQMVANMVGDALCHGASKAPVAVGGFVDLLTRPPDCNNVAARRSRVNADAWLCSRAFAASAINFARVSFSIARKMPAQAVA